MKYNKWMTINKMNKDIFGWRSMNTENFEEDTKLSTDTDESDSCNSENRPMKYNKWIAINEEASKVMVSLPVSEIFETVKGKINKLKYHQFLRNEQYKIYNNLRLQIPNIAILLHVN